MAEAPHEIAWLELPNGSKTPLTGPITIGRSPSNQLVLAETKVSRRHALIQEQGASEFWLVDLGSSNGTYLKGRRVSQPVRLRDSDEISLGGIPVIFKQPSAAKGDGTATLTEHTLQEIKTVDCLLLLADIVSSTEFIKSVSPEEGSTVLGRWFSSCKDIVDKEEGTINKFLGDGFLAYWQKKDNAEAKLVAAIESLKKLQKLQNPKFRVVIHTGPVAMSASANFGEESLIGKELHYLFRLEKLATPLEQHSIMSSAAHEALKSFLKTFPLGAHPLPGFAEPQPVFGF